MKDELYINDQFFCTVRLAASHVTYSKDYITRLARQQKIRAVHIGRNWYIDVKTLKQYEEVQSLEASIRNRQLKQKRKIEHHLRDAMATQSVGTFGKEVRWSVYAVVTACLVLVSGFTVGAGLSQVSMLASVPTADSPSAAVSMTDGQVMLVPTFTTPQNEVTVVGDRQVQTPATKTDWLRIRYE
jgi:hypothetical protein